ncbi:DUF1289 domain-containing protein [Amylibacter ulvae]|uniref:DUF1289 domain-containing protein n=1 Tax=Paramylibacter ulvae TaxID=1651968 RepID=A0ABQ3D507_9RHOB|nr:DUF1289 domain-containing protein [Amylibacter ulvae]GHA53129.1 DUF1289 domain-containing protein [Amylibacter ulvae]
MSENDLGEVWKRDEVESPCVKLCVIHEASGFCMGCYRTRHEIAGWSRMDDDARIALKETLPTRASAIKGKRRGRNR